MTDEEKARILAEKVHGWHVGYDDGPQRLWLNQLGVRRGRVSDYDPAATIAQAFEAIDLYGQVNKKFISIGGRYGCGDWQVQIGFQEPVHDKSLSMAITDALVQALGVPTLERGM